MKKRLPETEERYQQALDSGAKAPFDTKPSVKDFKHWRIIENEYPYDAIAKTHHLLIPKEQIEDPIVMSAEAVDEFLLIKRIMTRDYDCIWENTPKGRTVRDWFHVHLIEWK